MLNLRPYQTEAIAAINVADRAGVRRPLVVHPTGTGKTVTFTNLLKERAPLGRGLVMVHRDELANQTVDKINMVAPELTTGVVKAERNEVDADIMVASVQTLHRDNRLASLLAAGPIETVVVDEAHHASAPTWQKILNTLGSMSPVGPLTVGFTATPERNGKSLGVWERVVSYKSIREMIHQGYLCPIRGQMVQTSMDLGDVRVTRGDFQDGSLGDALEASGAIEEIADAYVKYASDRKGVMFTPTVDTAEHLAQVLNTRHIRSESLSGTTPTDERRAILARLKSGATQVVTNCAVLTEGFDEPSIECVVVARPTTFHGLYVQMVGRGTRVYPGKRDLLVLDVTGASQRHDLVAVVDLGVGEEKTGDGPAEPGQGHQCAACGGPCQEPEHRCRLCSRPLPLDLIRKGATRHENCRADKTTEIDVFATSKLRWLPVGDSAWCLGAGQEVVVMAAAGADTWKLAAYRSGKIEVLHEQIPADWAMGIGEDRAKAFKKLIERDARWLSLPATDAQKGRLVREGFPESKMDRVHTRGDAADLITRIQGRRAVKKMGV